MTDSKDPANIKIPDVSYLRMESIVMGVKDTSGQEDAGFTQAFF